MTLVSIKMKEPKERGNMSRVVSFLPPANEPQDLTYVIALVEANRERRLAALRISELSRQATDKLLHWTERATCFQRE